MACCAERAPRGLLALCLLLAAGAAQAQTPAPFPQRVSEAIAERWGVQAPQVQIKWQQPGEPSHEGAFALEGGANGEWLVVARGDHSGTWRLRAGVTQQCVVAARDLPRATSLAPEDMTVSAVTLWGAPRQSACPAMEGWVTRRAVRRGELLAAPAVAPPIAVHAGDDIRITFIRGSVELVIGGRAAGNGAVGERIAVRTATGKRMEATITTAGAVEVREKM